MINCECDNCGNMMNEQMVYCESCYEKLEKKNDELQKENDDLSERLDDLNDDIKGMLKTIEDFQEQGRVRECNDHTIQDVI